MNATGQGSQQTDMTPTIVPVHGAFAADLVWAEAERAGADIVEVEGSHVIMISQPQAVTDHILRAARAAADSPR